MYDYTAIRDWHKVEGSLGDIKLEKILTESYSKKYVTIAGFLHDLNNAYPMLPTSVKLKLEELAVPEKVTITVEGVIVLEIEKDEVVYKTDNPPTALKFIYKEGDTAGTLYKRAVKTRIVPPERINLKSYLSKMGLETYDPKALLYINGGRVISDKIEVLVTC